MTTRSVNKVILLGNITRDPQVRTTQSGQKVCTFGIATNRNWITSDGRQQTSAEYTEVAAWAKLAEICEQHIRKGKLVYVEGYLKTRSWDTPEGIRRFKTEVVIQDMIMLDRRNNDEAMGGMGEDVEMGPAPEDEEIIENEPMGMNLPQPAEEEESGSIIDKDLGV